MEKNSTGRPSNQPVDEENRHCSEHHDDTPDEEVTVPCILS